VDGIYVKAGLEKEKAALLVVIGALSDGTKQILAVESGYRESEASWSAVLRDLKDRGMNAPRLVVGDGHLGIWSALTRVFPDSEAQRCWNQRMRNILDCVSQKSQPEAKELLRKVMYTESLSKACAANATFEKWAAERQHIKAVERIDDDWERMTAYYSYPKEHWTHLRTSNVVESPFASVRLRTEASKRYKKIEGCNGDDLETANGRGAELPPGQGTGPDGKSGRRGSVQGWSRKSLGEKGRRAQASSLEHFRGSTAKIHLHRY
jgi:transposase-like protein